MTGRLQLVVVAAALTVASVSCMVGRDTAAVSAERPRGEVLAAEPLHNVIVFGDGVISGSAPDGDAAFDALRDMGVRTVISVDAMTPDVDRARDRDLRYVHVPVEYARIDPDERATLARALRDAPRPIYVHCHHGVHRGPAAAALALVALGELTAAEGESLMRQAGTSESYAGLYACVQEAGPMGNEAIDAQAGPLVEVADVGDVAGAMARIDRAWDHLKMLGSNQWRPLEEHPDLDPLAEAAELHDLLRALADIDDPRLAEDRFARDLRSSLDASSSLEALLRRGRPAPGAVGPIMDRLSASCRDCHRVYR